MNTNTNDPLPPCAQDWQTVVVVHTRKREMIKAGINPAVIHSKTEWVQYGSKQYPRTYYRANVAYFNWPIQREEVDGAIKKWEAIIPQAKITTYYHCAD